MKRRFQKERYGRLQEEFCFESNKCVEETGERGVGDEKPVSREERQGVCMVRVRTLSGNRDRQTRRQVNGLRKSRKCSRAYSDGVSL